MNYKKLSEDSNMAQFEIYNRNSDIGEKHALVNAIYMNKSEHKLCKKLAEMICDSSRIYWAMDEIRSEGGSLNLLKVEKYLENWLYAESGGDKFIVKCNSMDLNDDIVKFEDITEISVYKIDVDSSYEYSRLCNCMYLTWQHYTFKEIYNL